MSGEWEGSYSMKVHYFNTETGKVLGYVEGSYGHSQWDALAYGQGPLGRYMTKSQAQAAVEQATIRRQTTTQGDAA